MGFRLSRSNCRRVTLLLLGVALPAWGQNAPPLDPLAGLCRVGVADAQTPAQAPVPDAPAAVKATAPAREADAAPPRAKEVGELAGLLKALSHAAGAEKALAGLAKGQPFTPERYALVLADVRSAVTQIHSTELLANLERSSELRGEARKWVEHQVRAIDTCARSRYVARGGSKAFDQVRAVVTKHRAELEPVLFQGAARPPSAAPSEPTPEPSAEPTPQPEPRKPTSGKKGS